MVEIRLVPDEHDHLSNHAPKRAKLIRNEIQAHEISTFCAQFKASRGPEFALTMFGFEFCFASSSQRVR